MWLAVAFDHPFYGWIYLFYSFCFFWQQSQMCKYSNVLLIMNRTFMLSSTNFEFTRIIHKTPATLLAKKCVSWSFSVVAKHQQDKQFIIKSEQKPAGHGLKFMNGRKNALTLFGPGFFERLWPRGQGTLCPLLKTTFLFYQQPNVLFFWKLGQSLITWHTLVSMAIVLGVFKAAQILFSSNTSNQRHCTNGIIFGS